MKKLAIILTIVATTAMIFSSCGKYEEGPSVSLLTKKARITGTWTLTETTYNGVVQDITGYTMSTTLEKDGTGEMALSGSYMGFTFNTTTELEWEFNDTKETLRVRYKEADATVWEEWTESTITKLTNSEFWMEDTETEGGVTYVTVSKMTKD